MTRYEYTHRRKRRRNNNTVPVIAATVAVVAVFLALLFFFVINRFTVTVTLNGDETTVVEQGGDYVEKGATAQVKGTIFFKTPRSLEVKTEGRVDTSEQGKKFTVKYTAKYMLSKGEAVRTVVIRDTEPPVIELKSDPDSFTPIGEKYAEEGYSAYDNADGDITDKVTVTEKDGVVVYTVSDSSGNVTTVQRTIKYKDVNPPEIKLNGDAAITITAGDSFIDPGCSAVDKEDGDISANVTVEGSVNTYAAGDYTLTYSVKDSHGNGASVQRTVTVKANPKNNNGTAPAGRNIYLTFDDGPGKFTPKLLDVLKKYNVKATFFVTNQNTDLITREYNEGHSVGIHTACHVYSEIYKSDEAFYADLNKMGDIIAEKTGSRTNLMRFPGGSSNMVSQISPGIMTRLTKSVVEKGYQYFDWNVSSGDAGGAETADEVYRNVVEGCTGRKNSVVLQHDTKGFSVDAVERIITWGLSNGYNFLPLKHDSPAMHHGVNN